MTEILFYHLEAQPLERVLPVLLERSLERGWRAVVETSSLERAEALDTLLWTFRDDSFVPHGIAGEPADPDQPVLIAMDEGNPNAANVRFYVDRAVPRTSEGYERIVYMFSGHDPDAVTEARVAWKALGPGNELTYWQQDENGRWVKKG
ncbi:MAG: DNA polymerase III subunit chi [Devosia nanyangense]|uniref:DNA polymerase III subunit chi n=1 Tax=Devosia nanyangense TaxID=1228055 RepID=A0A933L323_9HYPH|nr:DNA polymerase III subunit chi [Devosia nanyangense]